MLLPVSVKWNFAKFLVGRNGEVIQRYPPNVRPSTIAKDVEKALLEEVD